MRLRKVQMAFAALILLICATGARADTYLITVIDATFSTTCIGGSGTCTEVANGTALYNTATNTGSDVSMTLTGNGGLNGSLDGFYDGSGTNPCVDNSSNCLPSDLSFFYDSGAVSGDDPIEFHIDASSFGLNAPSPEPLVGGPGGTELFVPDLCGGDQLSCGQTGTFPSGDYNLTSGKYTSVDESAAPEPNSVVLLLTGIVMLGFLSRRFTAHIGNSAAQALFSK
jgi:hypothetical protein